MRLEGDLRVVESPARVVSLETSPIMAKASNQKIAHKLRELADLFEQQGANPFRVGAYMHASRPHQSSGKPSQAQPPDPDLTGKWDVCVSQLHLSDRMPLQAWLILRLEIRPKAGRWG